MLQMNRCIASTYSLYMLTFVLHAETPRVPQLHMPAIEHRSMLRPRGVMRGSCDIEGKIPRYLRNNLNR